MPHVIRLHECTHKKRDIWAQYSYFREYEEVAEIARVLGLPGKTTDELVERVVTAYFKLAHSVGIQLSLKELGVLKADLEQTVDRLAELAYEDNCTVTHPQEPLNCDLKHIILDEYEGTDYTLVVRT